MSGTAYLSCASAWYPCQLQSKHRHLPVQNHTHGVAQYWFIVYKKDPVSIQLVSLPVLQFVASIFFPYSLNTVARFCNSILLIH